MPCAQYKTFYAETLVVVDEDIKKRLTVNICHGLGAIGNQGGKTAADTSAEDYNISVQRR